MTRKGWREIADALKKNEKLRTLSLDYNKITDEDVAVIADGLRHSTTLRSVDLEANRIRDEGGRILLDVVKENEKLIDVTLMPMNQIDASILTQIKDILDDRIRSRPGSANSEVPTTWSSEAGRLCVRVMPSVGSIRCSLACLNYDTIYGFFCKVVTRICEFFCYLLHDVLTYIKSSVLSLVCAADELPNPPHALASTVLHSRLWLVTLEKRFFPDFSLAVYERRRPDFKRTSGATNENVLFDIDKLIGLSTWKFREDTLFGLG